MPGENLSPIEKLILDAILRNKKMVGDKMGGINIDNQSLSSQSSSNAESTQRNAGLLLSLACAVDKISARGTGNANNSAVLTSNEKGMVASSNPVAGGPGEKVKDDSLSDMVKISSSDLNKDGSGNPLENSMSSSMFVDFNTNKRSPCNKEQNRCTPKVPQEDGLFPLGASGTPEQQKSALQGVFTKGGDNVPKSCLEKNQDRRKQKEKISHATESQSCSNKSVESINSKRPISVGKRAWCFERDMDLGCSKRLRGVNNEINNSRPQPVGRGGSFFSWIANISRGLSESTSKNRSLMLPPNRSFDCGISNSFEPLSQERNGVPDDAAAGFESFVKAMYGPSLKSVQGGPTAIHDGKDIDMLTTEPSNKYKARNDRGVCNVLQPVPLSSYRNDDCLFGDCLPENVQKQTSSNSPFKGKLQYDCTKHCKVFHGVSSCSSAQCSVAVPSKSSNCRNEFLGSTWIRRLSKSSQKVILECSQDRSSAPDQGNWHVNSVEDNDATNDQEQITLLSNSSFRVGSHNDQKLKSRLSRIVPSPICKKLEPMTSEFAKRVDALRQMRSPGDVNAETTNMMCNFCGTSGHDITICPEISSFERDDLLKNNRSCDWSRRHISLCIRCFRLNHWAVACPYVSQRSKPPTSNVSLLSPLGGELKNRMKSLYSCGSNSEMHSKNNDGQEKLMSSRGFQCGESSNFQAGNGSPVNLPELNTQSTNPKKRDGQKGIQSFYPGKKNDGKDIQSSNSSKRNLQKEKVKIVKGREEVLHLSTSKKRNISLPM